VKDREVLGDIGLFHKTGGYEIAHTQGPVAQGLKQREAVRLGEHGKEARNSGELARGKGFLFWV
jgi:hypothetical protein